MKTNEVYLETLQILKSNKEKYMLLDPYSAAAKCEEQWLGAYFPFEWGRVQWQKVLGSCCHRFEHPTEAVQIIKDFCKDFLASDQVTILWFDLSLPALKVELETALKYANLLIEETWDTWFLNKSQQWCLEVHHRGEVCFGYSPLKTRAQP